MSKSLKNGAVWLPFMLAVGVGLGILLGRYITQTRLTPAQEKMLTVLDLIEREYVDVIDTDSLLNAAFPSLLMALDPHSAYISPKELNDVNSEIEGSFSGIGVSFQILNDSVVVVEVIPGGPAEKVGLQPGDRIISANDSILAGPDVTNQDVFNALRGPEDTKVKLQIKRTNSTKPYTYEVVRGEIPVNSVDSHYIIADGIGYLKINKFSRTTYNEMMDALADLRDQGAKDYIIDLRDNVGGLLDQAILMANEFLPKNQMIVYTKGRTPENEIVAISDGNGSFQNVGLTVLINEYSASSSEIFAGAMQDNDRGQVIGRRSFGKGLVQNQTTLNDSSAIRLTVARYYTPSGRCIQKPYKRGKEGKYEMDITDRYTHGEFYNADSIKFNKDQTFKTLGGRTVYGGGGIMPDVFVPQDTTGFTSYYLNVANRGLLQRFAFDYTDRYRSLFKGVRTVEQLEKVLPSDSNLLETFVAFAAKNGVPARWYYINQSRDLLIRNIKALIARDAIDYNALNQILNEGDPTVEAALKSLQKSSTPKRD